MNIGLFKDALAGSIEGMEIHVPVKSQLFLVAGEITGMAHCYLEDGTRFSGIGDPVNALASFSYSAGWLDLGSWVGVISATSPCSLLLGTGDPLPDHVYPRFEEKTHRYSILLGKAITSSAPVSPRGVSVYEGGVTVQVVARTFHSGGMMYLRGRQYENALACFSYGHGWLDAAVRTGLLGITGDRNLFAV